MADPVVLVTGAKGQVGSAITRLASTMQVKVIALGSSELDIGNRDDIERSLDLYTPDVLINAAAYTAVDRAELEPELAYRVNATGAANLAATAVARNMPLIHLSTDYVFDGTKTSPYLESDPACPIGVYGASKLAGEEAVQSAGGGQWIIVRTSWVFGLEGHNFPKTIMRLAAEREQLGVVADQRGCPTFADDIARAVLALSQPECRCGGGGSGIYHYAGTPAVTWHAFATVLVEKALRAGLLSRAPELTPLTTAEYPTRARRPANSVLDCSKLHRQFPQIATSDWASGINCLISHMATK